MLQDAETGVNISLQDADGVFLTVKPIDEDLGTHDDPPGELGDDDDDDTGEVDELTKALHEAEEQQAAKDLEIARLQEQLEREKERYKKLWSLNCAQLAEFDSTVSAKDEELEQLKSRLHRTEPSSLRESPPRTPSDGETEEVLLGKWRGKLRQWRCSVAKTVKMFLMIGFLVWCEQQNGTDGPNLKC